MARHEARACHSGVAPTKQRAAVFGRPCRPCRPAASPRDSCEGTTMDARGRVGSRRRNTARRAHKASNARACQGAMARKPVVGQFEFCWLALQALIPEIMPAEYPSEYASLDQSPSIKVSLIWQVVLYPTA